MIPLKLRYHMIMVVGEAEQGKTTFMVRHIAREMLHRPPVYIKAFLNIHTQIPNANMIQSLEEFESLDEEAPNGVPRTVVGIDQIHKYCHARESMSQKNIRFTNVVVESRQHGFDLIGTTWGMKMIDANVRKYVDLWILAQRKVDGFHYTFAPPDIPIAQCPTRVLKFDDAQKWWNLFDTTELIPEVKA